MKKVLIFIQDQHELKKLTYVKNVSDRLNLDLIDVITIYKSEEVRGLIERELNIGKYIITTSIKIDYVEKLKYRLNQLCFFLKNRRYSSCTQKIYEFLGYSKRRIILNKIGYMGRIVVNILIVISNIFNCKFLSILKNKNNQRDAYDYIIFIRSDSLKNNFIIKEFSSKDTKVITIIRNIDTPLLKGPYVVKSDYTFCTYEFEYKILEQVGSQYTGELIFIQDKNTTSIGSHLKKRKSVLVCLAAEWFIKDQKKMLESLIKKYLKNKSML